jgi:hypothetical protein
MGHYAALCLIDVREKSMTSIEAKIEVFEKEYGNKPYFMWGHDSHTGEMVSYADGTLLCNEELTVNEYYPKYVESLLGENIDSQTAYVIDVHYKPPVEDTEVLWHLLLPERYIIAPYLEPRITPKDNEATISIVNNRLALTFSNKHGNILRCCVSKLKESESYSDFKIYELLSVPKKTDKINWNVKLGYKLFSPIIEICFGKANRAGYD